ncbi:MAG: hypothetical protein K2Y23_08665 [Cyanobacteria bacterium]|nr:hypothetical protein [Cyanobacteriota bacterium]
MTATGPQRGSPARYVGGMVCLIGAMVTIPAGFVQMIRALERGGYGTTANTVALAWIAVGGGLLGLGIALLIWELSVRHNVRH